MAIPALVAGAGLASRGLASYLAKNKAKKEMMKAGLGATRNASIPSLVSTQRNPGVFAKRAGLAAVPVVAGTTAGIMQGGDGSRQEGTYMANPMAGISQNPSYDASMTMDGQIQTMMEEMDGMDLSEEAKRQIIQDKLGINYGYLEMDKGLQAGYGGDRFDKAMTMNPGGTVVDPDGGYGGMPYQRIGKQVMTPFNALSDISAKKSPMTMDKLRAMLREETGAGYTPAEKKAYLERIQAIEARDKADYLRRKREVGAGMTSNEMRMFMGIPQ